jgi:hypothetical protein
LENTLAIIIAIGALLTPFVSYAVSFYATKSQLRQAEMEQGVENRKVAGEHELDLARFKRDVEADLWARVKDEIATERAARLELAAELERERQARRELSDRVAELTAENERLREDNMALLKAIGGRKNL